MNDLIRYLLLGPGMSAACAGFIVYTNWLFSPGQCPQVGCAAVRDIAFWYLLVMGVVWFFVTLPAAWDERHFIRRQLAARRKRDELKRSEFTE